MPQTATPPAIAASPFIAQDWASYSAENHEVWALLYRARMETLQSTGSHYFLDGAAAIGLSADQVPDLADVNRCLAPRTGWRAVPVNGFLPAPEFFACLADRRFPTTVTVRPKDQLAYLPEPDIFHDVFGHVPLHADPVFGNFLQRFGAVAAAARTDEEVTRCARLFWFTVEFGLIREAGAIKLYGSGLISSSGDAANALSDRCDRRPFTLDAVLAQPFEIDHFQDVLYVVESFDDLYRAVDEMEERLK